MKMALTGPQGVVFRRYGLVGTSMTQGRGRRSNAQTKPSVALFLLLEDPGIKL